MKIYKITYLFLLYFGINNYLQAAYDTILHKKIRFKDKIHLKNNGVELLLNFNKTKDSMVVDFQINNKSSKPIGLSSTLNQEDFCVQHKNSYSIYGYNNVLDDYTPLICKVDTNYYVASSTKIQKCFYTYNFWISYYSDYNYFLRNGIFYAITQNLNNVVVKYKDGSEAVVVYQLADEEKNEYQFRVIGIRGNSYARRNKRYKIDIYVVKWL